MIALFAGAAVVLERVFQASNALAVCVCVCAQHPLHNSHMCYVCALQPFVCVCGTGWFRRRHAAAVQGDDK